jgi:ferrous iron transport protein B
VITDTEQGVKKATCTIAIAGNPNSGKTTLFNGLTGSNQHIGNWPGVTVEKKEGNYKYRGRVVHLIDLPGIYSLSAYSEDEKIARGYILSGEADVVINIIDAGNLERNLYLTTQLLEMRVPCIVVLNMMDLAQKKGIEIDISHMESHLGCPVVAISAVRRGDIEKIRNALDLVLAHVPLSEAKVTYTDEIEEEITKLVPELQEVSKKLGANERWTAVKVIENDNWIIEKVLSGTSISWERITEVHDKLEKLLDEPSDILVADCRYGFTHGIVSDVMKVHKEKQPTTERIDRVVLSRVLGIPIFLIAMYIMFFIAVNVGGAFIDLFDGVFGAIFVDGFSALLGRTGSADWLVAVLAGGVGGGIRTLATFVPVIFFMFFMLAIFEDSGYMARAAFVMDRFMRWIGLPGKAFVPLLIGFGCNVPAIMATRTLENRRDRIVTVFILPLMSCSARLPVYALFAAAFFPRSAQNIVFSLYVTGIVLAILTGLLFRKTLFGGAPTPFVMELPPYHSPRFRHIMHHSWIRLKVFMLRARVLIPMMLFLTLLNSVGTDGSFGNENSEKSVLSKIGKTITPAFRPIGIDDENWPASVALFTGLFAKEAVVGTMNAIYSQMDMGSEKAEEETVDVWLGIEQAARTVPVNILALRHVLLHPFGAQLGEEISREELAAQSLQVDTSVFYSMRKRFTGGPAQAYAYLLFILIYVPCIVAVTAIAREIGVGLTVFSVIYLTVLGWIVSTLFYQLTVGFQPLWIAVPLAMLSSIIVGMRVVGKKNST